MRESPEDVGRSQIVVATELAKLAMIKEKGLTADFFSASREFGQNRKKVGANIRAAAGLLRNSLERQRPLIESVRT